MHIECFCSESGCAERNPSSLMTTISPGSISRTYFASIRSKAQVSEAITQASCNRPSASGRKPRGSRIAINSFGVRKSIENAPSVSRNTSGIASVTLAARERAMPCRTTSVSEVDEKIAPSRSSFFRSSRANGRLPLWQMAIWPCWQMTENGWHSRSETSPAVE